MSEFGRATTANEEIARGLSEGDVELVDRLIDEHAGRLFRFILLLVGNHHQAEDIFQETWVRVLERGRQYKGEFGFQGWLLSIARHLVIDQSRQKRPVSLDGLASNDTPFEPHSPMCQSPLERLCREEQQAKLDLQARRLPAVHREVFLMRMRHEMPLADIAEATNVPLSTVKRRLYRAVATIQSRLSSSSIA